MLKKLKNVQNFKKNEFFKKINNSQNLKKLKELEDCS